MTAVNHVLAGAIIGATITQPVLAIPLALVSHFVLDALPHFGFTYKGWQERLRHRKLVNIVAVYDVIVLLIAVYLILQAAPATLVIVCAAMAVLPDLVWVYRFIFPEKWGTKAPSEGMWLTKFHYRIQKYEFKEGIIIEVIATIAFGILAARVI